jgi:hypothetical protein
MRGKEPELMHKKCNSTMYDVVKKEYVGKNGEEEWEAVSKHERSRLYTEYKVRCLATCLPMSARALCVTTRLFASRLAFFCFPSSFPPLLGQNAR